ncbi:MAG: deoxynucleoside kinase [Bacteroidia bacterium]
MNQAEIPYSFIAIEGNIGSGKTSLAKQLAAELQARLVLEEFEDNSFLPKFYKDARRYAFPLEMSFLAARFNQLKGQLNEQDLFNKYTVSDYLFAKCLLFSKVNLDEDEYELYSKVFGIIQLQLRKPDLLVYIHNPIEKLLWQIKNRGRAYEQEISSDYLESLQTAYFEYLNQQNDQRILILDCSALDYVNREQDYLLIKEAISQNYEMGIHTLVLK